MPLSPKGIRYIKDVLGYSQELLESGEYENLNLKDILGFSPPRGVTVFLPNIKCVPTKTLLPLYDTLVVGIPSIKNINKTKEKTGLTFDEIITLSQKGKLILYINADCPLCLTDMSYFIEKLVDNNVDFFFSVLQSALLCLKAASPIGTDVNAGIRMLADMPESDEERKLAQNYRKIIKGLGIPTSEPGADWIYPHLLINAMIKPTAEYLKYLWEHEKEIPPTLNTILSNRIMLTPGLLLAKALSSNFSTNIACRFLSDVEDKTAIATNDNEIAQLDNYALDFIEKKLKIAYSDKMSLSEYSDLFDSNTTKAIRQLVKKVALDSSSQPKSLIGLQKSINDYNRQVEELAARSTKRAKIVYATSDILRSNGEAIKLLMQGASKKFLNVPDKAWDCAVVPAKYRSDVSNWLKEKALNIEAKLAGVSPEVLQLYRTRTCMDKLEK